MPQKNRSYIVNVGWKLRISKNTTFQKMGKHDLKKNNKKKHYVVKVDIVAL